MMEKTLILKHISRMLCLLISYSKFTRTKIFLNHGKIKSTYKIKYLCRRSLFQNEGNAWDIRALPDKWSLHRVQENKAYNKNAAQK